MSMVAHLQCPDNPDKHSSGVVVWAFDHETANVSGIANLMRLKCPRCGEYGAGYDGSTMDDWQDMHLLAERMGWAWMPHPYNEWKRAEPSNVGG